jgi:3-hydroxyisobutyrate dehydrogenase
MSADATLPLGFVGIGTMGAPMVGCLVRAGFAPVLCDADAVKARETAEGFGLAVAPDPAALAERCSVVVLMLPHSGIVRDVCMGNGAPGLIETLAAGSVIVDMSSSDPVETRKLGAALAAKRVTLLDAPVSGGVRRAVTGSLAILLGGDDAAAMARCVPVLEAMGTIHRTGGLGSGHAAKALNNYVSAAGLAAACEAVIIGRRFGLEPETLVGVLNASTGRNNSTENKLAQFVLNGQFKDAGFALDLMAKDVGLAQSLAEAEGASLPGVMAAGPLWAAARDALGPGADHTEIFRYLQGLLE